MQFHARRRSRLQPTLRSPLTTLGRQSLAQASCGGPRRAPRRTRSPARRCCSPSISAGRSACGEVTLRHRWKVSIALADRRRLCRQGRSGCRPISETARRSTCGRGWTSMFEAIAARGDFEAYAQGRGGGAPRLGADGPPDVRPEPRPVNRPDRTGVCAAYCGAASRSRIKRNAPSASPWLGSHPHGPPAELSLDVEHAWSVEALERRTQPPWRQSYGSALDVARKRWPKRWIQLSPAAHDAGDLGRLRPGRAHRRHLAGERRQAAAAEDRRPAAPPHHAAAGLLDGAVRTTGARR